MKVLSKLDSLDNIQDGETRILPTKVSDLSNDTGFITAEDDIFGNAATATLALNDKDGNDIVETYVTKAGDTMVGALTTPTINISSKHALSNSSGDLTLKVNDTNYAVFEYNSNNKTFRPTETTKGLIDLGSSNQKWNNIYANGFTGDLTGTASRATGDKNGNDITTTYYKASNPNGYTSNIGTITGITMNGASKGTSGVVNLGTVITSHQSIKTINNNTITGTGNVSVGTITGVSVNGTSVATSGTANITSVPASILTGTVPAGCYTDTKNTAGSTDTSSKIFLVGATSQAANPQTYSDNEIFATNGVLSTKSVQVGGALATMQYNSTDECVEFLFA